MSATIFGTTQINLFVSTVNTHFLPLVLYKFQVLRLLFRPLPPTTLIWQHQLTSFLLVNNLVVHSPPCQLSTHLVCIHICTLATFSLPPFNCHIQHFECPILPVPPFLANPLSRVDLPSTQIHTHTQTHTQCWPENY